MRVCQGCGGGDGDVGWRVDGFSGGEDGSYWRGKRWESGKVVVGAVTEWDNTYTEEEWQDSKYRGRRKMEEEREGK